MVLKELSQKKVTWWKVGSKDFGVNAQNQGGERIFTKDKLKETLSEFRKPDLIPGWGLGVGWGWGLSLNVFFKPEVQI